MVIEHSLNSTHACNLALAHIGQNELTDLATDVSVESDKCRLYYSAARKDFLGSHSFNFNTVQESMTLNSNDSLDEDDYPEWSYFYTYPSNALTIWAVFNEATVSEKWEQEFETFYRHDDDERVVATNQEDAFFEYSFDVTDLSMWDNKAFLAFTYHLASILAKVITGDQELALTLAQTALNTASEAKRVGHAEKKKKVVHSNRYIDSRG